MKKYGKLFAGLIVFYLILMFGTTRIGGEQLEKNVNASLEYLEEDSADDIEPTSKEAYIYYKELHNKRNNVSDN